MEIRTVPQERLSTSIRQFPDKTGYQGRIFFRDVTKTGNGQMKTETKANLNPSKLVLRFFLLPVESP